MVAPHPTALRRGTLRQVSSTARGKAGREVEGRMFGAGRPTVGAALEREMASGGKRAGVSQGEVLVAGVLREITRRGL